MIPLSFSLIIMITWFIITYGRIVKDNLLDDKLLKHYLVFVAITIGLNIIIFILKFSLTVRIYIALFILLVVFIIINAFLSYYVYKTF